MLSLDLIAPPPGLPGPLSSTGPFWEALFYIILAYVEYYRIVDRKVCVIGSFVSVIHPLFSAPCQLGNAINTGEECLKIGKKKLKVYNLVNVSGSINTMLRAQRLYGIVLF